jgi:hypothetical protein
MSVQTAAFSVRADLQGATRTGYGRVFALTLVACAATA